MNSTVVHLSTIRPRETRWVEPRVSLAIFKGGTSLVMELGRAA
ncbi:MAG: hypothetical protein AAF871_00695 [Pseudomonadota bacterium]